MRRKFKDGDIVSWTWQGVRATGIIDGADDYIYAAVDFLNDSNVEPGKGEIWWCDNIRTDETDSHPDLYTPDYVSFATAPEAANLARALVEHIRFLDNEAVELKKKLCIMNPSEIKEWQDGVLETFELYGEHLTRHE